MVRKPPKLSVILTSKDRRPFLDEAIRSVLQQDYRDLESIVVDDSQDQDVRWYLKGQADADPRVRVVKAAGFTSHFRESHKMVGVMVNRGLDEARGEYVSYLCDDDQYLQGRCRRMMQLLDAGVADMVVDRAMWRTSHDRMVHEQEWLGDYTYPRPLEEGHWELLEAIKGSGVNFICHDSVMHRRTDLRWPVDLEKTPVDWRFWISLQKAGFKIKIIAAVGEVAYVPGTWKNATIEEAVMHRTLGGDTMKKIRYAKNVSGKIQILPFDQGSVKPGERVEAEKVVLPSRALMPGFAWDDTIEVPKLDSMPKNDGALPPIPEISEPIVMEEATAETEVPNIPTYRTTRKKKTTKKKAAKKTAKKKTAKKKTAKKKTTKKKAAKKKASR